MTNGTYQPPPAAQPVVCSGDDEFHDWWKQEGQRTAHRIARGYLDNDDADDVVQVVYIKLSAQYYGAGKSIDDVRKMLPLTTRNTCIDLLRRRHHDISLDEPSHVDGATTVGDTIPDADPHADPAVAYADLDFMQSVGRCLYDGLRRRELKPQDVRVWVAVRVKGLTPGYVASAFDMRASAVSLALGRVDDYVRRQFYPRVLADKAFTPDWVRKRPSLMADVFDAGRLASGQGGDLPPTDAATLAQYVALTLRADGRLDRIYKPNLDAVIASTLCDMCWESEWLGAPFAADKALRPDVERARKCDAEAERLYRDGFDERANIAKAEAIRLHQSILVRLSPPPVRAAREDRREPPSPSDGYSPGIGAN